MPGRGSYGPGGKWIHDRAHRIMEKGETQEKYGPERGKSIAYAIATQQAHKMGKTPKKKGGYGTKAGRAEARAKYDQPRKEYRKTASTAGQDLRSNFVGGTQFPTADSLSHSQSLLNQSQRSAEVGPTPAKGFRSPTVKQMTPSYGTTKGDIPMPKTAEDARYANDPLVQYMKKQAESLTEELGADSPGMDPPESKARQDFSSIVRAARAHEGDVLQTLFDNASAAKRRSNRVLD